MKHRILILLALLCLGSLAEAVFYYPQLPGLVATHFNAAGRADGWMPREAQLTFHVLFVLGLTGFFVVGAFSLARLPRALINLPHREYWFAPERQETTRRQLTDMMLASACGVLAFFLFLFQRVYQANLDGTHRLSPPFWGFLTVAIVLTAGPAVRPLFRFWKLPADPRP